MPAQQHPKSNEFILLYKPTRAQCLLAFISLLASLFVLRHQIAGSITTHFLGGSERDAGLYIWLTKSNLRDFISGHWFSTSAFYPYGETLAWSDNYILPSLLTGLFTIFGASLACAYNLTLLTAGLLNGLFAWLLCFKLRGQFCSSLLAGVSFLSCSFISSHLGHPQLQFAFWLPLGLIAFISALAAPSFLRFFVCGLAVSAAFLCSVYYSIFLALLLCMLGSALALIRPHLLSRDLLLKALGAPAGLLPLVPFLLPYLDVGAAFGGRYLHEHYYFSATAASYFSRSAFNQAYKWSSNLSHPEAQHFPGLIILFALGCALLRLAPPKKVRAVGLLALTLFIACGACTELSYFVPIVPMALKHYLTALFAWGAIAAIVVYLRLFARAEAELGCSFVTHRDWIAVFLGMAAVLALVSFGPLGMSSWSIGKNDILAVGPHRLLYELFPGFEALRAIGRIGLAATFLAALAGCLALSQLEAAHRFSPALLAVFSVVHLMENYHFALPIEAPASRPEIFEQLERAPRDGAAIVLPLTDALTPKGEVRSWGTFAQKNVNYMLWAFDSGKFLVNGYSGQRSKIMKEYPARLVNFPDATALKALSEIVGLRYVVLLASELPPGKQAEIALNLERFSTELLITAKHEDGDMLLEFNPSRLINQESDFLLAANDPQIGVVLRLKTDYQPESPRLDLNINAQTFGGESELTTLPLPADGEWHDFNLRIPRASNAVPPAKLFFKLSNAEAPLYYGGSRIGRD